MTQPTKRVDDSAERRHASWLFELFRAREAEGLRSLFVQSLDVFERSVEGRVLDRISHEQEPKP